MPIPARITTGDKAWELLDDLDFKRNWSNLFAACPWATPFQSYNFVYTWFANYRSDYDPVIACVMGPNQSLYGLLLLAWERAVQRLVIAGAHQAEYQCWLSSPKEHLVVLEEILTSLSHLFPGIDIAFKYLPSMLPAAELAKSQIIMSRAELRSHRRPLMRIKAEEIEKSFRKKSNKSRFSRLIRIGSLTFQRITDVEQFDQCFDDIAMYYDFRQGAMSNSLPFTTDPFKRSFHIDLLRRNSNLLHVTVMSLSGRPIAAHLGIVGNGEVHLAIVAHSPFFAKYSPGKLHLMMLSRLLKDEGIACLDLTPGGDAWKERFATDHDAVWELVVHSNPASKLLSQMKSFVIAQIRCLALSLGLAPSAVRRFLKDARRTRLGNVYHKLRRTFYEHVEFRVYRHTPESPALGDNISLRRDYLGDLLKFKPAERWQETQAFLKEALHRLELGEHVYTLSDEHKLLHYGWLIEEQSQGCFTEVQQCFDYPEHSAVLYDFYTDPESRNRGLYRRSLHRIVQDALKIKNLRYIYISVSADNGPSRHVIEKLGFEYQCSLFSRRILGRVSKA